MSGQSLEYALIPLPGGGDAEYYQTSGLIAYHHADWLGSERLASTPSGGLYDASAYGPFGESYAQTGSDPRFTGQIAAIATGSYDFLMREYSPTQSRWWTPDPGGLAAVNPNDPQSWNAYAYVAGTPLAATDPLGLDPCEHWIDHRGYLQNTCMMGGGIDTPRQPPPCTVRNDPPGHGAHLLATNFDVTGDKHPRLENVNFQDCQPGGSHPSGPAAPIGPQPTLNQSEPGGPVCVSAAQINAYLAQTPLAGQGQNFYNAGQAYDVNPALAVAIAGAESTFGENVNTTWGLHNAWGWGSTSALHHVAQSWTTWQQGIYTVTFQLSDNLYLGGGLTTTAAIYGRWCQSGDCAGGLAAINGVLDHFGVNPASLRFKACTEEGQ